MPEPIDDPRNDDEPIDGASLVDPSKKFSPACMTALRAFRAAKPWRGTPTERMAKFQTLHAALCDAYGLAPPPTLEFIAIGETRPEQTGTSGFDPRDNRVVVAGRLSVASYLWAVARTRGLVGREAFAWSLSLFARVFPRSFGSCRIEGTMLLRDGNQNL
jgi:hypothetical protein